MSPTDAQTALAHTEPAPHTTGLSVESQRAGTINNAARDQYISTQTSFASSRCAGARRRCSAQGAFFCSPV